MKHLLTCVFILLFLHAYTQTTIRGTIIEKDGTPIYLATVQLKNNTGVSTASDQQGKFSIQVDDIQDTLVFSNIGFDTQTLPIAVMDIHSDTKITLKKSSMTLEEVFIRAEDPISSRFSVSKIEKFDIYLNPLSQGDPLKAITILPSSTTTDESALPSLRGSSSSRTSVRLNGVPLVNPVRAQNVNSQGFFSLFNPEIIDRQYVYASNPPLIYGNASSGVVDIHTNKPPVMDQIQVSTSLANIGMLVTKNIDKGNGLIQAYSNFQFSGLFTGIQPSSFKNIKDFSNRDVGVSYNHKLGRKVELKSYNYFINEKFNGLFNENNYYGPLRSKNNRFFSVNSLVYYTTGGVFMLNTGYDISNSQFTFGNLSSDNNGTNLFSSLNYKKFVGQRLELQAGADYSVNKGSFNDRVPVYYYAISPSSPSKFSNTDVLNKNLETYLFMNWKLGNTLSLYSGGRKNLPTNKQENYVSYQIGINYKPTRYHSFILGGGKYHNYAIPTTYSPSFDLMKSNQVSVDYQFKEADLLIKGALYYKNEIGDRHVLQLNDIRLNKLKTFGAELYFEKVFLEYFKYSLSNSFIDQKIYIQERSYNGPSHLKYFVKTFVQYNNPSLFSASLTYLGRPGTFVNSIDRAVYNQDLDIYFPILNSTYFNKQLPTYNRFDVSFSKFFRLKTISLAAFISMNNVLNTKNAMRPNYSRDYSSYNYEHYQYRTLYFGAVWYLRS
ncbi:TonB-dependent receptor [Sphingobacterium lactis]|uniref:TonB-dependent receptor n=1 Tax=Sphingobacterium lactis TaxID=797291 RepID=UPI003EC61749